jgi:hypothetical protein
LSEPGGGPGGSVSWRAAPSGLIKIEAARQTASRMAAANGAKRRTAPSPLDHQGG